MKKNSAFLILALLGVGIAAVASTKKKSSRLLQLLNVDWPNNKVSYLTQLPGIGKSNTSIAVLGTDNKFIDIGPYTILINSDMNTNMLSLALFGEDMSFPLERVVIDFIRKNVTVNEYENA